MIEFIRKRILKDTGILVIPANTTAKKPPLPYATINVTSPWINDVGHADISTFEDGVGIHMHRSEAYQIAFSLNVYAESDANAIQIGMLVRGWFVLKGESFLEDLNVVVVTLGNIGNRTAFLVDSYENKHGFDVQLRATDNNQIASVYQNPDDRPGTHVDYDWIETVEIEFEGVE